MLAAPKILLLATLAFCTFSATVSPQTPSAATDGKPQDDGPKTPFVFKTSSRLVVVDVVATNSKGEPVKDLKAGDFVVTEEGSAQTISSFSFQQPTVDSGGPRPAAEQLPPGVITNTPRYKKGAIWSVIVLDGLNSPMLDQSDTRQQLLKVLEKLPDQPVAIYVLGTQLMLMQDFNSDPQVLKRPLPAEEQGFRASG